MHFESLKCSSEKKAPLLVPVMSAVTERDADGNPVVHTEVFDIGWVAISLALR